MGIRQEKVEAIKSADKRVDAAFAGPSHRAFEQACKELDKELRDSSDEESAAARGGIRGRS